MNGENKYVFNHGHGSSTNIYLILLLIKFHNSKESQNA